MTEFGIATVFGSIPFAIAFVPAFAFLANYGLTGKVPSVSLEQQSEDSKYLKLVMRDMCFICASLLLFYVYLEKSTITLNEVLSFLIIFVVYIVLVYF
jgi:Ca2+/Na+ antiporter